MKNNFFSSKIPKIGVVALLFIFCGLFSQTAMGQQTIPATTASNDVLVWTGAVSSDWDNVDNWNVQSRATTGVAGTSEYPGQNQLDDWAFIPTGATNSPIIKNAQTFQTARVYITNQYGAGATLTIDSGGTLNVVNNGSNTVVLGGGSIINNGTLSISSTAVGFTSFPVYGIQCTTPNTIPSVATEYGYSGSGTLSISMPSANFANSACISSTGTSTNANIANVTYKLVLNSPTLTWNQVTTLNAGAIRANGITNASHYSNKLLITGTGFTIGTVGAPYNGSLLSLSAGTDVTIDTGTTLTFHSKSTNTSAVVTSYSAAAVSGLFSSSTLRLTNKGTIDIQGASSRSGFSFATGTTATNRSVITNEGTVTVNLICSRSQDGAFATGDGGGSNLNNTCTINNSGTMNLTNTLGSALYASQSYNTPPLIVNNTSTGTLNLDGALSSGSPTFVNDPNIKGYINNSGQLNTNHELANVVFTNTSTGTIAFANAASAATTNALVTGTFATNDGKIQTGSAKLNNLGLIAAYSATSIIEPGGTGKGIADFNKTGNAVVLGKLAVQVSGNTAAGTDYDQITNSFTDGGFDVTGAILDVTSISGTASPVDIIVANGAGTIAGPFQNVTGLTSGWSVNYDVAGKVQLVYSTATTWNGTAWSNGTPDATKDAIIDGTYGTTANGTFTAKSLTVNSGKAITVNSTTSITVENALVNNGTVTVENNANLRQTAMSNTNSGTGTAIVNRNSAALKRLDFAMWSSPVSGSQTLEGFSPNTSRVPNRFYTYNPTGNVYSNVATTSTFAAGTGYLIRMPNDASTSATEFAGVFTGTPNNGTVTLSGLTSDKYYSVGNPYPSTISADLFLASNPGTLYFWRKTNGAAGGAYASYNGTGAASGAGSDVPNGTIQVGQGFIAKTGAAATSLVFTNAMRTASSSTQIFKTKKEVEKSRVWLDLTATGGSFSQALVGYLDGATLGVDNGFDGKYLNDSPTETALTSIVDGGEYTIQGRPAFDVTDVVALGFKTGEAGDFTIAINKKDGLLAAQDIYLVDSKTGIETDLNANSYTFNAEAGVDNTRFSLKYQKTLKVDAPAFNDNSVKVYKNNGSVYVNSSSVAINTIEVYDIQGKLLVSQRNVKANTATINNLKINQVLIVKISDENNSVVSKKILN
jgi:hypothetical protein